MAIRKLFQSLDPRALGGLPVSNPIYRPSRLVSEASCTIQEAYTPHPSLPLYAWSCWHRGQLRTCWRERGAYYYRSSPTQCCNCVWFHFSLSTDTAWTLLEKRNRFFHCLQSGRSRVACNEPPIILNSSSSSLFSFLASAIPYSYLGPSGILLTIEKRDNSNNCPKYQRSRLMQAVHSAEWGVLSYKVNIACC